jgi:uncharacterized damage-inducible protein DinB
MRSLPHFLLDQLEREAALSRKTLERVPEGQNGFRPHERSMDLGYLAALVARMPDWIALMIDRDEVDFAHPAGDAFRPKVHDSRAALLLSLESAVESARRALRGTTEEHLDTLWAFKIGGKVIQEHPRHQMISDAVFSHLAHHRGQLTVYLRLASSAVPALYGPSADERF